MKKILNFRVIFMLTISFQLFGQFTVSFPYPRAVIQRNSSQNANIYISGTYTGGFKRIEARTVNRVSSTASSWLSLVTNPVNQIFNGTISSVGTGWYNIEIRGVNYDNSYTSTFAVERVGVGEVFLIAGQSNAQGVEGAAYNMQNASADMVNAVNFRSVCDNTLPPFQMNSHLDALNYISYNGNSSWAYTKLGDLLAANNIPSIFYNAAIGGTSIDNWYAGSQGLPTNQMWTCAQICSVGNPYNGFAWLANYYVPQYGARAVLWHQGESDNNDSYCDNVSELPDANTYKTKLEAIIAKSKVDLGYNIPWVVARASYFPANNDPFPATDGRTADDVTYYGNVYPGTRQQVIDGQNLTVQNGSNAPIYYGPETDLIARNPAIDNIHFSNNGTNNGIDLLGTAWYNSLTNGGVLTSPYFKPIETIKIPTISCSGGNVTLTAPSGYTEYKWVLGNGNLSSPIATTQVLSASPGNTYRCYLKNAAGKYFLTTEVKIPSVILGSTATATASSLNIITGSSVTLTATGCNGSVSWEYTNGASTISTNSSTNANPFTMTPSAGNTSYVAKCTLFQGCPSYSAPVIVSSGCQNTLMQNTNITSGSTNLKEATVSITATGKIQNTNTKAKFEAGTFVLLNPGFEAENGTVFRAEIGSCDNN